MYTTNVKSEFLNRIINRKYYISFLPSLLGLSLLALLKFCEVIANVEEVVKIPRYSRRVEVSHLIKQYNMPSKYLHKVVCWSNNKSYSSRFPAYINLLHIISNYVCLEEIKNSVHWDSSRAAHAIREKKL